MVNPPRSISQQRIIIDNPPMIEEIDKRFDVLGRGIVFSWGDVIYNPMGIHIPVQLMNHEAVHREQQVAFTSIEDWWKEYIRDWNFRLDQEVFAHAVEYQTMLGLDLNRHKRRAALRQVAARLAGPLYGSMVSEGQAGKLILRELRENG